MTDSESYVDVLVIGAGPAGLMCANALAQAGVHVRIVDKRASRIQVGHADGIHARTLEILQSYGLKDRLIQEGQEVHRAAFYVPSQNGGIQRLRRGPAFTAPTARYPFACTRHQGGLEALLIDAMKAKRLEVERPTIPVSLEVLHEDELLKDPSKYPIKILLKHLDRPTEDSEEVVNAKFAVGADGAHSWTRKVLGISLKGDQSDHIWGVVDILPDSDFPDTRNLSFINSQDGSMLLIPRENDLIRLYVQLSDADVIDPVTGRVDKERTTPQRVIEIAQRLLKPYRMEAIGEPEWWTTYAVGQRVAEAYSAHERVFIAGDACHTHSPKAGQGMNASMSDTHNLAWKLTYVLRGWADMGLLKTYEYERLKFAQELIEFDRKWAALFSDKASARASEEETHDVFRENDGFMSGLGLRYQQSAIAVDDFQESASKLTVGKHMVPHIFLCAADARPVNIHDMLPADMRFKVLVFVGNMADKPTAADVRDLADKLAAPESFLRRYGHGGQIFDVLCVSASSKDAVDYTDFPPVLRSHWSKVLLDDVDMHGRSGGGGFAAYGIDTAAGAMVVVRPDGHVGLVTPVDRLDVVDSYFGSFMLPSRGSANV
ncbi:FAD binding domain-containing protein [Trametes meyenii]|nr:FAD binding domain-containing protein [Trametes meyenii]